MNTFERVRMALVKTMHVHPESLLPETSLTDDLSADSLELVEVSMALEEEFGIEMGEDSLSLTTLQQLADYVAAKLENGG